MVPEVITMAYHINTSFPPVYMFISFTVDRQRLRKHSTAVINEDEQQKNCWERSFYTAHVLSRNAGDYFFINNVITKCVPVSMTKCVFPAILNLLLITFHYLMNWPGDTELLNNTKHKSLSLCVGFKPEYVTFTLKLLVQLVSCI